MASGKKSRAALKKMAWARLALAKKKFAQATKVTRNYVHKHPERAALIAAAVGAAIGAAVTAAIKRSRK